MIRYFQTRPFKVTAIQWTGDNLAELQKFAGSDVLYDTYPNSDDVVFVRTSNGVWDSLGTDRWVVRRHDGTLRVYTPDKFAAKYEPQGEDERA